ncbi:MAG: hypothetical protein ACTHU0_12620 [Kofleriaceae bacterium]
MRRPLPLGELRFELALPERLAGAALPIEVRAADRRLVGRFDPKQSVPLLPGAYYVNVPLPCGDELSDWVEIAPGAATTASLGAADSGEPSSVHHARSLALGRSLGLSAEDLQRLRARRALDPDQPVGFRVWLGKLGAYRPADAARAVIEASAGAIRIQIPPHGAGPTKQMLVQLCVAGRAGVVVVVPQRPAGAPIEVAIARTGDELILDAQLENRDADAMIRYATDVDRTRMIGRAMEIRGLLHAEVEDPIAAAAGAAALLGIDRAQDVERWLPALADATPWLADGPALAAEALARRGSHADALGRLLQLGPRGLPLFADSLAYAVRRLDRYRRARDASLGETRLGPARGLLERLQRYALFRVAGRPLTTFRALDPNEPSDAPFPDRLPADVRPIVAP